MALTLARYWLAYGPLWCGSLWSGGSLVVGDLTVTATDGRHKSVAPLRRRRRLRRLSPSLDRPRVGRSGWEALCVCGVPVTGGTAQSPPPLRVTASSLGRRRPSHRSSHCSESRLLRAGGTFVDFTHCEEARRRRLTVERRGRAGIPGPSSLGRTRGR